VTAANDDMVQHARAHSSLGPCPSALGPAWETLVLPAINEQGEPLWPGKWPLAALHRRRGEIGDRAFAQEYLQRPVSAEAQRFRPSDFQSYDPAELQHRGGRLHIDGHQLQVVIGVDPAIGAREENDFFSAAVVGFTEEGAESPGPRAKGVSYEVLSSGDSSLGPRPLAPGPALIDGEDGGGPPPPLITSKPQMRAYVLEVVRVKDRFARQLEILRELNRRWKPQVVGIESTAYQRVLAQVSCDHGLPVQELNAHAPKEHRIEALSGTAAQHCWHLPLERGWTEALRSEALGYPSARHDDQLDALARAQEVGLELLDNWRRRSQRGAHADGAYSVSGVRCGMKG
jgi:predicted phage terminase large subunit-like protein